MGGNFWGKAVNGVTGEDPTDESGDDLSRSQEICGVEVVEEES